MNSIGLSPANRFLHGTGSQHLAHAIPAIQHGDRTGIDGKLWLGGRVAYACLETGHVPRQPHDPVRLVAPQVGLDQGIGREPRIRFWHPGADVDGCGEVK